MKSTSEDIAIIISAINSLIADSGNITLELNGRKESLERDLLSLNELSLFTRIRYRKYLSQRIVDMKNEMESIKNDIIENAHSLRTELLALVRKLLLVHSNEKYAVSKKQRNEAWDTLSEWLAMDHESFIRYTNQCGCVV